MRASSWVAGVLLAAVALGGCGGSPSYGGSYSAADSPAEAPARNYQSAPQAAPGQASGGEASMTSDAASAMRGDFDRKASEPSRPGLGTQWGETRSSSISSAPFVRADSRSPFATAAVFYNDSEGSRAMANASGFRRFNENSVELGGGIATVRLKNGSTGRFLSGFEAGGKNFMVGAAGDRYSIVIDSHVPSRMEVVVSVDGLDVLDGGEAAFTKRGYLIEPHGSVEIDGFRQSMDAVAAFRFGSVRDSYAEQKHGESRNVGVIGVALFNEQGSNPSGWRVGDTQQRLNADPFPGKFATPP
jgi:hypothetical protein